MTLKVAEHEQAHRLVLAAEPTAPFQVADEVLERAVNLRRELWVHSTSILWEDQGLASGTIVVGGSGGQPATCGECAAAIENLHPRVQGVQVFLFPPTSG